MMPGKPDSATRAPRYLAGDGTAPGKLALGYRRRSARTV
jgi:hypothetical protein